MNMRVETIEVKELNFNLLIKNNGRCENIVNKGADEIFETTRVGSAMVINKPQNL
jgi:hypothetical protein